MQLDGFGAPQKQQSTSAHGVVEGEQHALLNLTIEVDQQIAAADQINTGKGRILDHVL